MYIPALTAAHFLLSLKKTINEVENTQKPNVLELQ